MLFRSIPSEGLFHKGIIQSGVIEEGKKEAEDDGTAIVEALLTELKLESVEDLETIPYYFLAEAYNKVPSSSASFLPSSITPLWIIPLWNKPSAAGVFIRE